MKAAIVNLKEQMFGLERGLSLAWAGAAAAGPSGVVLGRSARASEEQRGRRPLTAMEDRASSSSLSLKSAWLNHLRGESAAAAKLENIGFGLLALGSVGALGSLMCDSTQFVVAFPAFVRFVSHLLL